MRPASGTASIRLAPILLVLCAVSTAQAGELRLEGSAMRMFKTDSTKLGNTYYSGIAEYEFSVLPSLKLGLRLQPLFLYPTKDEEWPMYGLGAGVAGRLYLSPLDSKGLFVEASVTPLWHSNEFVNSTSRIDILSEAGVGYKFGCNVHLTLKVEHLSNMGMADRDAGVNGVGIGAGFSF